MQTNYFKRIKKTIKHWYLPLLVGIGFIAIGLWTFKYPLDSYITLSYLFSISFIVSGFFEAVFSITNREIIENWGWNLVTGIFSIVVGVLLFLNPEVSMVTLSYYVGFFVLFRSGMTVGIALDLKNYRVPKWGSLMFLGVLGVVLAFVLLWKPDIAGMSLVILTGISFIVLGIKSIMMSLAIKKIHDLPKTISRELIKRYDEVEEEIIKELDNLEKKQD